MLLFEQTGQNLVKFFLRHYAPCAKTVTTAVLALPAEELKLPGKEIQCQDLEIYDQRQSG